MCFIVCSEMGWSVAGKLSMAGGCWMSGGGNMKGILGLCSGMSSSLLGLDFTEEAEEGERGGKYSQFASEGKPGRCGPPPLV